MDDILALALTTRRPLLSIGIDVCLRLSQFLHSSTDLLGPLVTCTPKGTPTGRYFRRPGVLILFHPIAKMQPSHMTVPLSFICVNFPKLSCFFSKYMHQDLRPSYYDFCQDSARSGTRAGFAKVIPHSVAQTPRPTPQPMTELPLQPQAATTFLTKKPMRLKGRRLEIPTNTCRQKPTV